MVLYPGYIGGERVEIGILEAAASGNVSIIRRWLEDGGDANEEGRRRTGVSQPPGQVTMHMPTIVSGGGENGWDRLNTGRLVLTNTLVSV